ncbi:receptor-type tyrosine-protein phosphatase F isoform X2 [Pocillopora verrucosa]|uniref:receptor-type tyrosine-protein phosphatase F isoform X2 n=1 Tax=Pocillopora verrucosa TaxID=203993 RepID=UPI0033427EC7
MAQFNLELCSCVVVLAVFLPLASGACVDFDLGMGSGTIPDNNINASSVESASTPAKNGRLNYSSGSSWCAGTSDTYPYLQIDLQTLHIVCAVSTQGNSQVDQWVKNYTLQLSIDGTTWTDYKEGGQIKILIGNDDKNSEVKHVLYGVLTRYLRIRPQTHQGGVCMRIEVFGVKQKPTCDSQPIGLASGGRIPDDSFSATSTFAPIYVAKYGRLNGTRAWEPKTTTDPTDYVQIDLLYEYVICAVATQGNPPTQSPAEEWTTEYKLRFSLNGTTFFHYNENKADKAFPGNSGKTDTVKNSLKEFASAKFIRFLPTKYKKFKVLRVEAYGILLSKVPSQPPTAFQLTASSSTSITASWKLPPVFARHGNIAGFKLFYKKKSSSGSATTLPISDGAILSRTVTVLDKYTEYEFQVLAFTSDGDGPKSLAKVKRTMEDAPSQPPSNFNVTPTSSTGARASWQLPPANHRNGIIKGFKLFYKRKDSSDSGTILLINSESILNKNVNGLYKYTEYEFQVLAFTSAGDGVNSSVVVKRTKEDAPDAPTSLSYTDLSPSKSHGPRITLTWREPAERNGVIKSYTLFYSHDGVAPREISGIGKAALSHTVDVLGGVTYQFNVRAVTIKPGKNATKTVTTKEYAPGAGPERPSSAQVKKTTFNISWEPLLREKSYGKVILYEVKAIFSKKGNLRKRSVIYSPSVNTSVTFVVLSDLELCSRYNVSVRAYTAEGPGPYGQPLELETSRPEAPGEFKITDFGTKQITLAWKQYDEKEKIVYTVKYTGTKSYNKTFRDEQTIEAIKATTQKVEGLIPGTTYKFRVHGTSVCGESASEVVSKMTDMMAPEAPHPHNITDVEVSQTAVDIYLWPVEQKYGPVSAYQVIVLKTANGVKELPDNYDSKLKAASDAKKENMNFYIAAEIENDPLLSKPQKFTVGDGHKTKEFVNEELEKGENYIVYERALTKAEKGELKGYTSIVAKISITSTTTGEKKEKSSGSNAAAVAVPVVLLLLLIPAVVVAVFLYRRRRQSRSKSAGERSVQLDDINDDSQDLTSSTSNLVYQNVADIRRTIHGAEKQPVSEEKEAIYSEADDGKPKPIPMAEFPKYVKRKSENGAIVLREEFKYLPGGMQFSWEIGKSNRGKNRYGNIVSYDHSRVLLEEIEGDKNSSYINASYIPTYDEVTMTYIATQGPTSTTIADFWRMVWQENSFTIVMLTNLVELGKDKCNQYWPDDTSKFGAITVTLHKAETFADYVIRSLIVTKDSEKRTVQQFHYVTWPDKGVPQHSTALLGFRQKIHARHQATGGPLVVHCSAGVGRTGTYIAIDAMLESAEKIKTVFIQNYVQVMRRSRPHMVQKDDQYVFLHQAVMEALVCGNTEIIPQDLRIATNKLAKVHKPSKKTGYERELKRLELVTDAHASQEVATNAFMPANVVKNRFPNIVPLDNARVHLQASSQEKSYINASYVDDYTQRNAYILTQAPLDCTIIDFWLMISQYDIGTIVMLNNLEEGKQSYPQYWPSEGSAKYGEVTVQLLSQETSNNITTRRFSVENAAPPKKTSTLQHIQYTGWANENSCPDPQDMLDLMTTVQQSQQHSGNRVIVFQCGDGTGRSGCVATIMSVIERVKTEQTVDVFQTVKLVRAKRPGAVNTLELYMFCYKTVLAYLDSFSTYSNFAEC